jgi:hypothetical protein
MSKHYFIVPFMLLVGCCASSFGESIRFDVPATAEGVLTDDPNSGDQKTVQFVIPISATFDDDRRIEVDEISAEVHWNRDAFPIVDFSPRTAMQSAIEGAISIEKQNERSASAGVNLSSGYFDMLNTSATLGIANKTSETRRYQEIPQHNILISSGTVDRGTGAEFRFKPSRTSTLEGERDLIVSYRVPETWRAGILQVTCRAAGRRKFVGLWGEKFDQGTTFIVPVYLKGDDQARSTARDFVRAEQNLRREVHDATQESNTVVNQVQSLLARDECAVMEMLIHRLIQSDGNSGISESGLRLPRRVEKSARQFMLARQDLMNLNR